MALDGITWVKDKIKDFRKKTWGPNRRPKLRKRALLKTGDTNVIRKQMSRMYRWRCVQDIFTGLMDAQWRWTLTFLCFCFFGCWLIFTLIWWLIAFVHGDLQDAHLPPKQSENGWTPCVLNIHGFHSCFLYSLETQQTTGYGLRAITEECPEAIFILCAQCIIGMMIDSFTIGIVFAKMIRAKFATNTIQFSKNGVVCRRDGTMCIMFRVGDIRRSPTICVGVRAILFHTEVTKEGELLPNYQSELTLTCDKGDSSLFLIWPKIVVHEIDDESPFYKMTASDMLSKKMEIVLIMDATVQSTGISCQSRTSYLANEILWGHMFESMVDFNTQLDVYEVNWKKFDNVLPIPTPMCSAAELQEHEEDEEEASEPERRHRSSMAQRSSIATTILPTPSNLTTDNLLLDLESESPLLGIDPSRIAEEFAELYPTTPGRKESEEVNPFDFTPRKTSFAPRKSLAESTSSAMSKKPPTSPTRRKSKIFKRRMSHRRHYHTSI